ncbi:MAG: hypothetical protein HY280_08615 [Nitrospinae bacterium]|nr:hypothetical protein [Nitrospinota bacterium]
MSLAICKPRIRSTAEIGDLIFGFGGVQLENRLIYIAQVSDKLRDGQYYREGQFSTRPDCIYRYEGGKYIAKNGRKFHTSSEDISRDLGPPPDYKDANVLISNDFRYFGGGKSIDWEAHHNIHKRLMTLTRGACGKSR